MLFQVVLQDGASLRVSAWHDIHSVQAAWRQRCAKSLLSEELRSCGYSKVVLAFTFPTCDFTFYHLQAWCANGVSWLMAYVHLALIAPAVLPGAE